MLRVEEMGIAVSDYSSGGLLFPGFDDRCSNVTQINPNQPRYLMTNSCHLIGTTEMNSSTDANATSDELMN